MVDFTLPAALKEARRVLSEASGERLSCWGAVRKSYLRAKRALIDALGPETGRLELPYSRDPSPQDRVTSWRVALRRGALESARESLDKARRPSDFPPSASAEHRAKVEARRLASIPRREAAVRSLEAHSELLHSVSCRAADQELSSGVLWRDRLCGLPSFYPETRPQQSLTRGLATILREAGATGDEASAAVDALSTAAQAKPLEGKIVLSVNPLDLLLCSEGCAYSSCHRLKGEFCAGPQQYLHDGHTLVTYYYTETRHACRLDLPFKRARQLVHVDPKNGPSAAFMRVYGTALPADGALLLRRAVARLLDRLCGAAADAPDPTWYHSTRPRSFRLHNPLSLAYLDSATAFVALKSHARPHLDLSDTCPCGGCGGNDLDECNRLVCSECSGAERLTCDDCGSRIDADDSRSSPDGASRYCDDCYAERWSYCDGCEEDCPADEVGPSPDGRRYLCSSCMDVRYPCCADCDERHYAAEMAEGLCPDCQHCCEACNGVFSADDMSPDEGTDGPLCQECAARLATESAPAQEGGAS